jgi:hypothetical protein
MAATRVGEQLQVVDPRDVPEQHSGQVVEMKLKKNI